VTQTGELNGTPFYVSPEQVAGRPVDARSDVFSLGVTLYELLTLRRPFDGESSREVLEQIVRRDPPSPDRIDAELPRDLSAVVQKALEKNPAQRYESATAMAADLRRFLAHRPVQAQPIGVLGRLRRWTAREPMKAGLAAMLIVGVSVTAGLMTYVWSTQQATDIGLDTLRTTLVDEMLLDAVVSNLTVAGNKKPELVSALLELAPDDPYVLANCAIYYERRKQQGPARALQVLQDRSPTCDDPGLHRLEAMLQRKLENPESDPIPASELEDTPQSPLDAYVLSELSMMALATAMRAGDVERLRACGEKACSSRCARSVPRPDRDPSTSSC